ncbi:DNA polymerase III subunit beta [Actinokineospora diospyrosa]|uniref:DNA polymerase-3 subunit beta n=1 Tax=Actinokineospora diospyrosa TaxID=103728 RepID=A0ABT1IDH2_9PSEU|nr:DNA polymerase III subunit beta [Actinokineospora diospyrosa]MCP2270686.1 DNA polymerase-3 subunit beta [Actinokineospora diospyrosa]
MDLTAPTAALAAAAADLVRLVPGKLVDPVLSGVLLTATAAGVELGASDRERTARVSCPALVHTDGQVLVPAKPLAETLRALTEPEVRLVVEGNRLAIRAEGARFALPLLDHTLHPGVTSVSGSGGVVSGASLATALSTVASTAARDEALPVFTGVRLRSEDDRLVLRATDRYRMAIASLPWAADGEVDVMVPATLLVEVAKQVSGVGQVRLVAAANQFAASWGQTAVTTAVLDGTYLSETKLALSDVDTRVVVDADALAAATRRVALYSDARGVVKLEVGDSEVRLRATDQNAGEAEESVKTTVSGGRTSPAYQSRYLLDALRPFAGQRVELAIQPGMRATVLTAVDPGEVELRYILMPMLPPKA